jgi:hypothetical protein
MLIPGLSSAVEAKIIVRGSDPRIFTDAMRQKYVGKSVKSYWPVGGQTPIKYADY